jgi:hypothetical protein
MAMRDAGIALVAGSGVGAAEEYWRQAAAARQPFPAVPAVAVGASSKA